MEGRVCKTPRACDRETAPLRTGPLYFYVISCNRVSPHIEYHAWPIKQLAHVTRKVRHQLDLPLPISTQFFFE